MSSPKADSLKVCSARRKVDSCGMTNNLFCHSVGICFGRAVSLRGLRAAYVRLGLVAAALGILTLTAHATLPGWLQHVIGSSSIEAALFRAMPLPGVQALYPRPPKEAQGTLASLIAAAPDDSQLYALRAQTDEAALDFPAAEADWKLSVQHAKDAVNAKLALADFYQRRLLIPQELATLTEVAAAGPIASERFVDPARQRSWQAYQRMLALIADQGLPQAQVTTTFDALLTRYPDQPAAYAQFLSWQLSQKLWPDAEALIARYRKAFPQDEVFAIRAEALLEYRRGDVDRALATYDRSFQPLWPAPLVQSYFALLEATHRQRAFVDDARGRLARNPDGPEALNALARIFYYQQQAGRLDKAQQTIDAFRIAREARNGVWNAQDLATLAALTDAIHSYAESARYDYALASTPGNLPSGEPAAQSGLSGLVHLLLTAPDQPIALGAGNLTLYRDIATLDQGPGYWNGILSLWLNGASPATEYQTETAKAQSYFHRAKAAELLAELDAKYAAAPERAGLHAELIRTYAGYGESDAVMAAGKEFLASFPASSDRVEIAGLMADAYSRQQNTAAEFALYDSLLTELAAKTGGLPLTAGNPAAPTEPVAAPYPGRMLNPDAETEPPDAGAANKAVAAMRAASFDLSSYTPVTAAIPEAVAYARILDRYLGRLVAEKQLPQALTVLRRQLDANPDDPLLYERLANFLAQNSLSAEQEQTYKLAIAHFQEPGWYDKLARLYLRERNREAYAALTKQVTGIFTGTELDQWFARAGTLAQLNAPGQPALGPQLAVQLNLYAQQRFPHDLVFTRNLARAYNTRPTANRAAYEDVLRHHWWESDDLRGEFFAHLASTGKIQAELAALGSPTSNPGANPAALRELAELDIWTSHFEAAAPLMGSVAELYPADPTTGDQAVSLFRSLAYLDPAKDSTRRAAAIENGLIAADPTDANRLATLGDLYAEATATGGEDLAAATPVWRRIPALHPGTPAGFLTSATIFWDYFQFDDALAELTAARTRFHQPTLFGYEAGAIAENRRDMPEAVAEYTAVATAPPETAYFVDSLNAALGALFKPPSDAADSNLRSTTQDLFNAAAARDRLLQLATRPATKALVDQASAKAVAAAATPATLTLRADILVAQKRQPELAPLLEEALARAKTIDEAAAIGDLARTHSQTSVESEAQLREVAVVPGAAADRVERGYAQTGSYALNTIYEHALLKEIALAQDPVKKIELSYTLANSLEERKDLAAAAKVIDGVYRDNPRLLGVVRATTDFYARTSQPPRAIATLLDAAKSATPDLARSFTLEAAQKANDAGDTAQARRLAESLLPQTPYDATVLGIIAASYARVGDDAGLKAFYTAQLAAVKTAPLSADERRSDTALLRRGLIPALTRMKDYPGAVDQYIALLSAYPEDASTAQEAALYALRYSRQAQLVDFLRTTVKQSPRDSRFAVLLAQVDTTFEDLPGAVAAYGQAIAIRKDRADLYTARVDLELRLGQDEPAADDFNRLYLLSYKDPTWMVRLAELRARQQRPADAVKALETAWITGQPVSAANQFRVAEQLARWNLLSQAETFAAQGAKLAGNNLLANSGQPAQYVRILTRVGKPDQALTTLAAVYHATEPDQPFPPEIAAQYAQTGVSAKDLARDLHNFNETRRQTARAQLDQAVNAIGQTIQTYATPEQTLAYAQSLDKLHAANPELALSAASSAGLAEVEAEWRKQQLLNSPLPQDSAAYVALEQRRFKFTELGNTLELFASRINGDAHTQTLRQAAQAYRDDGDETDELRVMRTLSLAEDAGLRDRYLDLLLRHDRAALVALAGSRDEGLADAAANYAVAHATQAQALAAVAARSRAMPAVWRPATASLVLTNFASPAAAATPAAVANFTQSLRADATVAARVATPADPKRQLTGPNWFYCASRFGLFLNTVPKAPALPESEDFLPAELEYNPGTPAVYLHLARNYAEAGDLAASTTEYMHALELAPNNPAVHDEFAEVLYRADRHGEALAQWRTALGLMVKRQSGEEFFTAFQSIVFHLGQHAMMPALRSELDAVLHPYLARNGNYRSNELLQAIYKASATPAAGTALILAEASAAPDPNLVLDDLRTAKWLAPASRETILLRQIQFARNKPDGDNSLHMYQGQLVSLFLDRNELTRAQEILSSIPTDPKSIDGDRVVLAVRSGHLQPLLDAWREQPDKVPTNDQFNSILYQLRKATPAYTPNLAAIRPLEEFVFSRKQLNHALHPTDFLALAQTRLDTNDLPGALELLHRLTLQPTSSYENGAVSFPGSRANPAEEEGYQSEFAVVESSEPTPELNLYRNTDYAAALLEDTHHDKEAVPFLTALVAAVPWDSAYRLRLAEAELKSADNAKASGLLAAVARDNAAPYATRVQAAKDLAPSSPSDLGSAELTLLAANPHPAPAAARQPYFSAARLAATSAAARPDQVALLHEVLAIAPAAATANRTRFELLLTQTATDNASAILAIYSSLNNTQPGYDFHTAEDREAEQDSGNPRATPDDPSDGSFDSAGPDPTWFPFHLAVTLDRPAQIRLAVLLASAYARDRNPALSLFYDKLAVNIDARNPKPDPVPDPVLVKRLTDYEASLALEKKNALRRPLIHSDLDQVNQVRPRLTFADQAHAEAP
jgi:hypothetical protein